MELFLDTANIDEIRQGARLGVLTGITTNPSLVAKEGIGKPEDYKSAVEENRPHNRRSDFRRGGQL